MLSLRGAPAGRYYPRIAGRPARIIDPARMRVDPPRGGADLTGSLAATKLHPLFSWLAGRGVSRAAVCRAAGLPESLVERPDDRVGLRDVLRLFEAATALSGEELCGLLSGAAIDKGFSHLVGCVMTNVPSLGNALERFAALERLIDSTARTELRMRGAEAIVSISLRGSDPRLVRRLAEYRAAGCVAYARLLSGRGILPLRIEFAHARPCAVEEYRRILDCEFLFGRAENRIVASASVLGLPVREPNPELLRLFESQAAAASEDLFAGDSLSRELFARIMPRLSAGPPAIGDVARDLALGVRTLQERLNREGTSYRRVVDEARKASALRYIGEGSLAIGEIAFLTGFSEVSAFHRRFKRWSGMTPGEYRDSLLQEREPDSAAFAPR